MNKIPAALRGVGFVDLANGWLTQVVTVSPQMAQSLLLTNSRNRRMRPGIVRRYELAMRAGQWLTTPETVCLGKSGVLLNGQHRLQAIVESGQNVQLMIVLDVEDAAFRAMDRGAPRSVADANNLEKKLAEAARVGAEVCCGVGHGRIGDHVIVTVANIIGREHQRLLDQCNSTARYFSSAPFRLAAAVRLLTATPVEAQYVLNMYKALVMAHVDDLSPIAKALLTAYMRSNVKNTGSKFERFDTLARAWSVFDYQKRDRSRVQITYVDTAVREIADVIGVLE